MSDSLLNELDTTLPNISTLIQDKLYANSLPNLKDPASHVIPIFINFISSISVYLIHRRQNIDLDDFLPKFCKVMEEDVDDTHLVVNGIYIGRDHRQILHRVMTNYVESLDSTHFEPD